jgi:deoxycytidylate deaminase
MEVMQQEVVDRSRAARHHAQRLCVKALQLREDATVILAHSLGRLGIVVSGGSDVDTRERDVLSVMRNRALCWRCIAAKSSTGLRELDEAMLVLRRQHTITLTLGPCEGCQRDTLLYDAD